MSLDYFVEFVLLTCNIIFFVFESRRKLNPNSDMNVSTKQSDAAISSIDNRRWRKFLIVIALASLLWVVASNWRLRELNQQLYRELHPSVKMYLELPSGAVSEAFSLSLNGEENIQTLGVHLAQPSASEILVLPKAPLYKYAAASFIDYEDGTQGIYQKSGYIELGNSDIVTYRINQEGQMELIKK